MSRLSTVAWSSVGAYLIGSVIVVVGLYRADLPTITVGAFVVLVGLLLRRVKEIAAGKDGLKAIFFPDFAKEVAVEVTKPREPEPKRPADAHSPDERVLQRGAEDQITITDEATAVVIHSGQGQAQATIVRPEDIASSKDEQELARRVVDYLQQSRVKETLGDVSVQYNDFSGTAALDGHGGPSDAGILDAAGLDGDKWVAIGFEVGELEGFSYGYVDAVERSRLATTTEGLPGLAGPDGVVDATRFDMLDDKAGDFLDGFKRWSLRASYKRVPLRVSDPS